MSNTLKFILAAILSVLAVLVFSYPHLMVSPGKLIPGHKALKTNCFACHTPFGGSDSARCVTCHKPEKIGRLTTVGQPIKKPLTSVPFHQKLINQDCIACHSDHAGVVRMRAKGHFNHDLLEKAFNDQCQTCHKPPGDSLHQQITGNCSQCHNQGKWVPATFEHDKRFSLDAEHNTRCITCHANNDYSRYTCYGCHEHTPDNIRRKHIEEGVRDFSNCVKCHRSANEHEIGGGNGENEGGHSQRKQGDDD
jgi:hypothetical protein